MISGYVTFDELHIITGLPKQYLKDLLKGGIRAYYFKNDKHDRFLPPMYDLREVEQYMKANVRIL
jgi:hypothetical protein